MIIADSYYGEWRSRLGLRPTRLQDIACLFLERQGQRFLVDFGYENAPAKAKTFGKWRDFKYYHLRKKRP